MTAPKEHSAESGIDLERIIFFSDAVYAIAITLLVIEIQVPEIPKSLVAAELPRSLLTLWPKFLSYIISFLVIGAFWRGHHRIFRYIKRYDNRLVWINMLLLLCVAFVPFPTALLGKYGDQQISAVVYAVSMAITGLMNWLLWWYASSEHRLVDKDLDPQLIRYHALKGLIVPVGFLLSIGVSFIHPSAAESSWILDLWCD
jgi:uncharacterized membrane protein